MFCLQESGAGFTHNYLNPRFCSNGVRRYLDAHWVLQSPLVGTSKSENGWVPRCWKNCFQSDR